MKQVLSVILFMGWVSMSLASQTYVPPPPPKLPAMLSPERVQAGKRLFEENVWKNGNLEIYNYLGKTPCQSCHDQPHTLDSKRLAKNFKNLKATINREIEERMEGGPLPLESPAMDSLVQYMVDRYGLHKYKLSK